MIFSDVAATVGGTPLVELARIARGLPGRILAKLEMRNPAHVLAELKRFSLDYKVLEDKDISIEALRGHEEAERVILAAVRLYGESVAELR